MSKSKFVDRRAGYLVKRVQVALRSAMDRALLSEDLTTPQYAVLSALQKAPGLSNAELARRSFVTPQTMIRIVASLEDKGLVTRVEHPSHGRILEASLTAAGEKTVNACHQRVKRVENRMEGDLSETERRTLADLLERCAVALGKSDE
jgi:DNA-binding MarR family transcriptional regulator